MKYFRKLYPDGGQYAVITDFSNPVITERINTYEDLFFIKSLKDICDYNNIENVELVISCLFQQQHDRRFEDNQSFELKLVADFINSCNFKKVHIFHPHSDSTSIAIKNFHLIDNSAYVSEVLDEIIAETGHKPVLLSTDGGSYKWINKLADKIIYTGEVYGASKARDPYTHKLTQVIDKQDFKGQSVVVIDDISVFGGTFLGLAKMLKERNVGDLYLVVSHITVKNPNKELEQLYKKVYSTNSKYEQSDYQLNNLIVKNIFKF